MSYFRPNTMTDKLFYLFDSFAQRVAHSLKQTPRAFCDVETIDHDGNTFVYKDGTMGSIVELTGSTEVIGVDEFSINVETISNKLVSYMSDGSHHLSHFFSRDPDGVEHEMERLMRGSRISCRKMGLDIGDIIDEQVNVMAKYCQTERCFLVLFTNMNGLSMEERKQAAKRRLKSKLGTPLAKDAQDVTGVIMDLRERHRSFVSGFLEDIKSLKILARVLDAHEGVREMRMCIDPEWTADDWSPCLPGDPLPMRIAEEMYPDASSVLWPKLNTQIFPREAEVINGSTIRIGDRYIAPISVELGPKNPEAFQYLFSRLNRERIPWRISFKLGPDGIGIMALRSTLASLMNFTAGTNNNKWLLNAQEQLIQLRDKGYEISKLQITCATWAPAGDQELIDKRRAILARCVQGWGACDVAQAEGDALETFISSGVGIVQGSIGNPMAPPLLDAIKMMPFTRPASPFDYGSQLLRTPDGKVLPYQPYSKLQTSWISLIFAPMGFGKSVFMNYSNLSLILSPELDELPFISVIDIGPSSKGLINLIKGALPEGKKHLAHYVRMKNTEDYSINVFDTLLGNRYPLSNHLSFLSNFLCFLATPVGQEVPYDGIQGMADMVIKEAYKRAAERKSAKPYVRNIDVKVDKTIDKAGMEIIEGQTKWWDVVDFLYKEGLSHEATLAQRHAVPTLADVASLAKMDKVKQIYEGKTPTHESLPNYFWRTLTEAINIYPIIGTYTQFDIGESRIVSLDLDEVAKGEGADAKKRTGLMYMLSYRLLTSKFFLGEDHLKEMEREVGKYQIDYRPYHERYINSIAKLPKRFCVDEKHRVKGLTQVENQFITATREGRKWKVEIMLASQLPDDFGEEMVNLATSIFILGAGSDNNADAVKKEFKLPDTLDWHLRNSIVKPSAAGSNLVARIYTNRGPFQQLCTCTIGPTALWAFNSSRDDSYIRDKIAKKIGEKQSRALLKDYFPGGSCDDEIERRKKLISATSSYGQYADEDAMPGDDKTPVGILDQISEELLNKYDSFEFNVKH